MFKQDLIKEILKDKTLDKDLVVVANTYQNISNEELIKKLNLLNAFVNIIIFFSIVFMNCIKDILIPRF